MLSPWLLGPTRASRRRRRRATTLPDLRLGSAHQLGRASLGGFRRTGSTQAGASSGHTCARRTTVTIRSSDRRRRHGGLARWRRAGAGVRVDGSVHPCSKRTERRVEVNGQSRRHDRRSTGPQSERHRRSDQEDGRACRSARRLPASSNRTEGLPIRDPPRSPLPQSPGTPWVHTPPAPVMLCLRSSRPVCCCDGPATQWGSLRR